MPEDMGVIVIVNEGSASASEVVSAVLQERGRATVVGDNTSERTPSSRDSHYRNRGPQAHDPALVDSRGPRFRMVGVTPDVKADIEADLPIETVVRGSGRPPR